MATKEEFMEALRHVERRFVVQAVNKLTPGVNWSGCSKGHIAERWLSGAYPIPLSTIVAEAERAQEISDGLG